MDTSTPDSPPSPDPTKPARFSKGIVLLAAFIIIPGLCFGIAIPLNWGTASVVLGLVWFFVALAVLITLLGDLFRFLGRLIKR